MNKQKNYSYLVTPLGSVRFVVDTFWYGEDKINGFVPLDDEEQEKFLKVINKAEKEANRKLTLAEFNFIVDTFTGKA